VTKPNVVPIAQLIHAAEREERADGFGELLGTLADLTVAVRKERERLERIAAGGDARVDAAAQKLAELEQHAREVGSEAASVHWELQRARLI
jgi:hypothetical protein